MREENPGKAMAKMCELFGKTRQAWYQKRLEKEAKDMKAHVVISEVKQIRKKLPRCGLKKLHRKMEQFFKMHDIKIGRDKFADVLRDFNLLIKKKKGRKTTNSNHFFRRYDNTAKDLTVTRVNQLYVGDITYIRIPGGFLYLSLLMDVYSRKIVGWSLREDLTHKGPLEALQMALRQRSGNLELTHHSDRGIQYCCDDYIKLLKKNKINISMTQNGDPYENALAERLNRTIKEEFLQYYTFFNLEQAKEAVARAVKMYNRERPHLSLEYNTPNQMYYDADMQRLANPRQLTLFTSPEAG